MWEKFQVLSCTHFTVYHSERKTKTDERSLYPSLFSSIRVMCPWMNEGESKRDFPVSKTMIRDLSDVDEASLTAVFAKFYGEPGAKASVVGDFGELLSGSANDNYNSEVKKLKVKVNFEGGSDAKEVNVVFKVPVQSLFLRRTQKVAR